MSRITELPATRPLLTDDLKLNKESRAFFAELYERMPIVGSGSPEGVETARRGRIYYDVDGATGTTTYIKRQPDIGGDTSKGWDLA